MVERHYKKCRLVLFNKALEVPLKFANDGANTPVRTGVRGTPMTSPLADLLTEVVLFRMDSVVAQHSDGALLHRLHDDFSIRGPTIPGMYQSLGYHD